LNVELILKDLDHLIDKQVKIKHGDHFHEKEDEDLAGYNTVNAFQSIINLSKAFSNKFLYLKFV